MSKSTISKDLWDFLGEIGIPEEERKDFAATWDDATRALTSSPQEELLWRLNANLRGDDPGPSINWPGERGLRA